MSAPAILAQIKAAGVRISRRGDNLLAEPRAAVTEPLLILMRAHKGELLAALADPPSVVAPDERAELRALVNLVADHNSHKPFTPEQRAEAMEKAIANPVASLEGFRLLAERDGLTVH
jgi:hypothetical protein